ncbi:MAG: DUF92 domain-containing protein [Chloroflexi bacterium]|nr:DUF92 domain-containing protein [Chloroflexota bacterium]
MSLLNVLAGLALSAVVSLAGYWRGSLSLSGLLGAMAIGTLIFSFGGLAWALLLIAFFVTSSGLSHYRARAKEPLAEKFQKGHRRDLGQVLANGGWGALLALAFGFWPQTTWLVAFVGAMSTVNADTWATELGVLSSAPPRLITSGHTVPVGTSGGITLLGILVSLAGALVIGCLALVFVLVNPWFPFPLLPALSLPPRGLWLLLVPIAALSGLLGSLFDSLLGATVQAIYYCDFDKKETESAVHRCGRKTRLIRGWRWLDNDWVNLLASVFGSGVALALYFAAG